MVCNEIKLWTFVGLVGAFLDLSIAFLLLCASSLAFFVSKFLGLFGLCLPCPCNGLFGDPRSGECWQRVLVDCPSRKLSSVQCSVKTKFPFDSIWEKNIKFESKAIIKDHEQDEFTGLDDEASCSSFWDRSEMSVGTGVNVMHPEDVTEGDFDVKGKEVWGQKSKYSLRRRKKGATSNRRSSSVSSFDAFRSDAQVLPRSCFSDIKMANASNEDCKDSSTDMGLLGSRLPSFESHEPTIKKKPAVKVGSCAEALKLNVQGELSDGNDDKRTIRILEEALAEEQAAHSASCLELEKERNAAATAADEAMAMILRLQEEKASIEMEARQYQRMIEEKSAYDLEEMNILKEILVRREREKHFLEKEVEAYRQMIIENEQLDSDAQDDGTSDGKRASSLLFPSEDPVLMLHKISESICQAEKAENANKFSENETLSDESRDCTLAFGKELPIPELDFDSPKEECITCVPNPATKECQQCFSGGNEQIDKECREIDMLSHETSPVPSQTNVQSDEIAITSVGEVQWQTDVIGMSPGSRGSVRRCNDTKSTPGDRCKDSEDYNRDSSNAMSSLPDVHDIHVIDDKLSFLDEVSGNRNEKQSRNVSLDITSSCDSPGFSSSQTKQYISRSCSEVTSGLPPKVSFQRKPLLSDLRRNSMSAFDHERFKIDNEVSWLRERLRIIQEGREKLNISMEHREKENVQLQLLENISSQLQEIRQLREAKSSSHQVSLPPPSCKVMSKKGHWRSISLDVRRSS